MSTHKITYPDDYMDPEEKELIESMEADEWTSVAELQASLEQAQSIARSTLRKGKRMNVRISERDMRMLKVRAMEAGIPYQSLVTMVLHKYVTGHLREP